MVDVGLHESRLAAVVDGREISRAFTTCRQGLVDVIAYHLPDGQLPRGEGIAAAFETLEQGGTEKQVEAIRETLFMEFPEVSADDSLAQAFVQCLSKLSRENRVLVAQNIILCGSLPSASFQQLFIDRASKSLAQGNSKMPSTETELVRKRMSVSTPCFSPNLLPWCGASIAASISQQARRRTNR